jgi:hypothetical protein
MAGNYADAPSWRMAYDRDGTQVFTIDPSNVIASVAAGTVLALNNEGSVDGLSFGGGTTSYRVVFIFPELRDLDGYFINRYSGGAVSAGEVSTNTTNGLDGTWTAITATSSSGLSIVPAWRNSITSSTALAIRAVRWTFTNATSTSLFSAIHLYGEPAPGENLNRLELWHPTLNEKLPPAYLDWGDVPRSSSADRTFRVKNLSASQTAGSVRVAMDVLTDANPSVPAQHTLSYGGGSFLAQVTIGDLSPGAISGPVTIRRVTPSNAALSLWAFRVFAESTNWS